jgi:hypothetical protein
MTRTGYKVARRTTPDHFASVLAPMPLAYQLRATSMPEEDCGPLCLFATDAAAITWSRNCGERGYVPPLVILRCDYEPWDKKLPRDTADAYHLVLSTAPNSSVAYTTRYEVRPTLVWNGCVRLYGRLPRGTRLAKSITPLEVVHETR